jgi:hypothetical protein
LKKKRDYLTQVKYIYPGCKHITQAPLLYAGAKILPLVLIIVILFPSCVHKQTPHYKRESKSYPLPEKETDQNPLKALLRHLRLTEDDLSIELSKTKEDFFRLEKVNVLLKNPLKIEPYADYLSKSIKENMVSLEKLLWSAVSELEVDIDRDTIQDVSSHAANQFKNSFPEIKGDAKDELLRFLSIYHSAHTKLNSAFSPLAHSDLAFLERYFSEMLIKDKLMLEAETESPDTSPSRREKQYVKEKSFYLASKIRRKDLYEAALMAAGAVDHLLKNADILKKTTVDSTPIEDAEIEGDIIACEDTPFGKVIIGGKGNNRYRNTKDFIIIDLGGDDEYHNISSSPEFNPFSTSSSIIVDLEGNDLYLSNKKYSQGSGSFGISFLVDYSGDDKYVAQDFSQGSGFFGVGILYDREGDDMYLSDIMGQGAAAFGVGILCDLTGNDYYHGNLLNQGIGFVGGIGLLIEAQGNDTFFSGGKYPDFREPGVAFDSFSQGFGYGYRNFGSGGIGVLWDDQGNDHYSSSYFSQGASYWLALGLLIDTAGSDVYHARRYTQGAGVHLSVGALIDRSGDDRYSSWGVSQGCGHDFSQGLLFDNEGDDTYSARWFAQGAGGSSAVGMLIDQEGDDSYQCGSFNSQGSGQYHDKRETGSIGLLIDLQGKDRYRGKGSDNHLWHQGKYGGGIDSFKSLWSSATLPWSNEDLSLDQRLSLPAKPPVLEKKELLPELEANLNDEGYKQTVIQKLSERGPSIIHPLIDYLDIKDTVLTLTIMEIIKTIGKDAGPELRTLLQDTSLDNSYNYYILYMLGDIADEGSQDLFSSFLEVEDPKMRAVAMRGISKLDPYLPLDKLMAYAEDENPSVRKYLAIALNNYTEPAALTSLTGLLADNNFNVRFAASESLKNKGEQAEKPLLDLINNQDSYPEYASDLAGDLLEEGF